MKRIIDAGASNPQWDEVIGKAIDKTQFAEVTTDATPNTEFEIEHGLGFIPVGFIVTQTDKAASVYNGATAWDTEKIYLKCNVASAAIRILIF